MLFCTLTLMMTATKLVAEKVFANSKKDVETYLRHAWMRKRSRNETFVFIGEIHLDEDYRLTFDSAGNLTEVAKGFYQDNYDHIGYKALPLNDYKS